MFSEEVTYDKGDHRVKEQDFKHEPEIGRGELVDAIVSHTFKIRPLRPY